MNNLKDFEEMIENLAPELKKGLTKEILESNFKSTLKAAEFRDSVLDEVVAQIKNELLKRIDIDMGRIKNDAILSEILSLRLAILPIKCEYKNMAEIVDSFMKLGALVGFGIMQKMSEEKKRQK